MAYPLGAVQVTGFIGTTSVLDTYATHLDYLGYGGLRAVADAAARDAITTDRRTFGMVVTLQDGGGSFILANVAMGGADNVVTNNSNWIPYATGGGSVTYTNAAPTTIAAGGYPVGSTFPTAQTMQQMWDGLLYPYVPPFFTSFNIPSLSTSYEVGTRIQGAQDFTWAFNNISLVTANTLDIADVTGGTILASGISIVSPTSVTIATFQPSAPTSYQWRANATNTQSTVFYSGYFTATWYWRKYFGTSALGTLADTDIVALANNPLASGFAGLYNFAALDFKYFCWPDSFGSPTASTGFKDNSTGLALAMADIGDDPSYYTNLQNGFYYGLVAVTNINTVTTNYRVYRTKNALGGTLQALVA